MNSSAEMRERLPFTLIMWDLSPVTLYCGRRGRGSAAFH